MVPVGGDVGAGGERRHFAIAHVEHAMALDTRPDFAHLGHIQRVVRTFAADDGGGQRHPQRVQHRQAYFELRQVGPPLLAVAELEQAVPGHADMAFHRRAVEAHPPGLQVVHAKQYAALLGFIGFPSLILAEPLQHPMLLN